MSRLDHLRRAASLRAGSGAHVTASARQCLTDLARLEKCACSVAMTLGARPGPLLALAHIGVECEGPEPDYPTVTVYGAPGGALPDIVRMALAHASARPLPPGAFASASAIWRENSTARVLIITAAPAIASRYALGPTGHACVQV